MNDDSLTEVTLALHKGFKVVTEDDNPSTTLSFGMYGTGATNRKSDMQSIDIFTRMETLPSIAIEAFNVVRKNVSWDYDADAKKSYTLGIAYLPAIHFKSQAERTRFQKGVQVLKKEDLVKKVSRNDYMLNPRAIIPTRTNAALKVWEGK